MRVANVVAAGVEPQVGVAVLRAVLLAVVEHPLQHVRDGAVVAAAVAGRQHDDILVPRGARIALHRLRVLWHLPVPFRLGLEVAGLGRVVVDRDRRYRLAGPVVSVVLDGDIAVEVEEDDEEGDEGDGDYDGPAGMSVVNREACCHCACPTGLIVAVLGFWWAPSRSDVPSRQHLQGLCEIHVSDAGKRAQHAGRTRSDDATV